LKEKTAGTILVRGLSKNLFMQIQQVQREQEGAFYIQDGEDILAEMTYKLNGENTMVIDHTEVDERLRGKNIGYELVHRGVEFARSEGLQIVPTCEFAKSVFEREEEFKDVLK
jgi:uncharacterized protein